MTIPVDQMTHEERCLWLAGLKETCHDTFWHSGAQPHKHVLCDGTGKVPRYPMLQGPCSNQGNHDALAKESLHSGLNYPCLVCDGRNWLPVGALEALLAAATQHVPGRLRILAGKTGYWVWRWSSGYGASPDGSGATLAEALSMALVKVERERQEQGHDR